MPKRNDFSSRFKAILWSLSQLIVSCKNPLTILHSHRRCSIVSSDTEQKKHFGSFVTLILHKNLLVAKILWLILVWNHCIVVSLVILKGSLKIVFHSLLLNVYFLSQAILPLGNSVLLFSIYTCLVYPFYFLNKS